MRCPFCQKDNDRVADTRHSADGSVVRRRRVCCACGGKFTTYEKIGEITQIRVIKKNGERVPFDREKLRKGIERACWKREISDEQIATLITHVELDIDTAFETEVNVQFIGERVMHYLNELDQVAYVRFASVYRQFKNVDDFIKELHEIKENPDMPSLSSEYVPKKRTSRFPKTKRNRYDEHESTGNLPLE
jgi:transcriptional repressor NrdR